MNASHRADSAMKNAVAKIVWTFQQIIQKFLIPERISSREIHKRSNLKFKVLRTNYLLAHLITTWAFLNQWAQKQRKITILTVGILMDVDAKKVTAKRNTASASKWVFYVNLINASAATVRTPLQKLKEEWWMMIS